MRGRGTARVAWGSPPGRGLARTGGEGGGHFFLSLPLILFWRAWVGTGRVYYGNQCVVHSLATPPALVSQGGEVGVRAAKKKKKATRRRQGGTAVCRQQAKPTTTHLTRVVSPCFQHFRLIMQLSR